MPRPGLANNMQRELVGATAGIGIGLLRRSRGPRLDISSETGEKNLGGLGKSVIAKRAGTLATKTMGQYLGTRAQPGPMSSRPGGPLLAS